MVIYFKSEKALRHFLIKGYVYTLRARKRKHSPSVEYVKRGRSDSPVASALVELIEEIDLERDREKLEKYVGESGFNSVEEWVEEFRRLNKNKEIKTAYLYLVKRVRSGPGRKQQQYGEHSDQARSKNNMYNL